MTVDNTAPPEAGTIDDDGSGAQARSASRPFLVGSLGYLAVALVLGLLASLQRVFPDLVAGLDPLVYGKMLPMATNAFLFGWLTMGLAGALLHVVVRSGRGEVPAAGSMRVAAGLMAAGVAAGTVGIAIGHNEGRHLLEYPLWADIPLLLGMIGVARGVGLAARTAVDDPGPVRWYAVAASWWLVLAFVAGNVPGLTGLAGTYQTSFFHASIIGLWLASAGVAVVYHVIPRLAGRDALVPTRLTLLGFWSLALVWALTAPARLTYGPAPDWLATVGVVFSMGLLIPGAVIFTDLVLAMRRRRVLPGGGTTMRFAILGAALFALWPVLNLVLAMRATSAVVRFTDWGAATLQVALYGAFTAWLITFVYHAAPDLLGRALGRGLARVHYFGTVIGLLVWSGTSLVAGVTTGWGWVGAANEADVPTAGAGWENTLDGLSVLQPVALAGLAVFFVAQLVFLVNVVAGRGAAEPVPRVADGAADVDDDVVDDVDEDVDDEPAPELRLDDGVSPGRLRVRVVGLYLLAALLVWVVPTLETGGAEATLLADESRDYVEGTPETEGRQIYVAEGCWYCHTQEVRAIVTDVGLGAVSVPGDYVHEGPVLTGVARVGPDLMHAGSRSGTDDPSWVAAHIADPRGQRPYSTMPAYDHLSSAELDALAAYIVGMK